MATAPLLIRKCNAVRNDAQGLSSFKIDEVAILFPNVVALDVFRMEMKKVSGVVNTFNVTDTCQRTDAAGRFDVSFNFFVFTEYDWRIEAMAFKGEAPLHQSALLESHGEPIVIHASFKCANEVEYGNKRDDLLVQGEPCKAAYMNSYGLFSYYGHAPWYIKPRVNLRDKAK